MSPAATRQLTERQRRYLDHIEYLMLEGATGEVCIKLHEGGVRDYRESRSREPDDLLKPLDLTVSRGRV